METSTKYKSICFLTRYLRTFYRRGYDYCVEWLPLHDNLLKSCTFVDFGKRLEVDFSHVEQTIASFSRISNVISKNPSLINYVEDEFMDYQAMTDDDLPQNIWESAKLGDGGYHRMDAIWGYLKPQIPLLADVALSVLVIPHSNAGEEMVFSMIRKNKTEFLSQLSASGSLNSIMRIKLSLPEDLVPCYRPGVE